MPSASLMIGGETWGFTFVQTGPEVFYEFIQCTATLLKQSVKWDGRGFEEIFFCATEHGPVRNS